MIASLMVPTRVSADAPVSQELNPNYVFQNSFPYHTEGVAGVLEVLANRTADADYLWDDDPGVLALTADAADDSDYFGTATVKLGLEDPGGVTADYYNVRVYIKTIVFDDFLGSVADGTLSFLDQYTWAWFGVGVSGADTPDIETYYPTDTVWEYVDTSGTTWYNGISLERQPSGGAISYVTGGGMPYPIMYQDFDENPMYERPWTLDEVNNMYIWGEFGWSSSIFGTIAYYDGGTLALALAQFYVEVFPDTDYTAPTNPTGSFIIRPDSDIGLDGWANETGIEANLWASLDETTSSSDLATTYIYTNDSNEVWYDCTFTDPPAWAANTEYALYPWLFLQCENYEPDWDTFYWHVTPRSEQWETLIMPSIMTHWCNRSVALETVYSTGEPWTLAQITRVMASITVSCTEQVNISQMAILCVPTGDVIIPPGEEPADGSAIMEWFTEQNGVIYLFGIMGFVGVIAVPVMGAYAYKEGGGAQAILGAVMAWFLFMGFLLVGVFAGG